MENKFYVYAHINPLKNEIFYIGKGSKNRAYKKGKRRSELWNNIVNKYGFIIDILESNLTEKESLEREKFYIKKIGRRDLGLGTLVNHTDGGDGLSNISSITRKRMSISAKNKPETSEETRKKHSKNRLGIKRSKKICENISKDKIGCKGTRNGIILSEETKSKMRESSLGIKNPMYGKKQSKETTEKRIKSLKLFHLNKNKNK